MNKLLLLSIVALIFTSCAGTKKEKPESTKPNIVYIIADDLGYGDLSSYGQTKFSTPNIDKLGESGIQFTQHYSGCTVCAPSRSVLMTGKHSGHSYIRGNREIQPEGQFPMEAAQYTVAEILKDAGYNTGAFGKWGLGFIASEGDPTNQGFDEFYGYNCQREGHHYYPEHLWMNQEKVVLEGNKEFLRGEYGPQMVHNAVIKFIEDYDSKKTGKPFFLYYPTIIPHAELAAPEEYMAKFRGKFLPEKKYRGAVDGTKQWYGGGYSAQEECHAAFAAMVTILDDYVGNVVAKLKELGIYDNTLIIFTSDNGPHLEGGADPDYFNSNGVFRGYKRDLYEGGIRVPMLASWNGKIKAGTTTDHISAFWDIVPTVCDIVGTEKPVGIDGVSMLPTLLGEDTKQTQHEYLYWEFHSGGGRQAIRKGDWKLVKYNVLKTDKTSIELYNLATDPGESNNVAEQNAEIVKEILDIMSTARTESDEYQFLR